jgi:peroxiredoxin
LPSLNRLHRDLNKDHFVLLSVDVGEEKAKVSQFAMDEGISFPVLLDNKSTVAALYGVRAHPVAYLIDTDGDLIGVAFGYRRWDPKKMEALVRVLVPESAEAG